MKAVHLLINSYLPDDLKSEDRTYTVKELNELMHQVATRYPDQFDNVLRKISNTGRRASYLQGETITLQDLAAPFDKKALFEQMDAEIKALPKDKDFEQNRRAIYQKYNQMMEKLTSENALKNRNNISMSVLSGARGKSAQLKAMITSPGTYSDYKGNPIDVFSKESFAEGITPTTFAASSFGTRSSVISTKCLDYQSLVKMADLSEKKLCDIKVGDMVLGADKEGKVFPVKVLNVFDQGEKECYKYTFRYSNSKIALNDVHVTCTEDHKFLTISSREYHRKRSLHKRGNGPAPTWEDRHNKEIHPAYKFNRASRASDYNPLLPQGGLFGTKNEPWARILGLLIGDGCLVGEHARCAFSCADPQLIEEITPDVMALGQKIKKAKSNNFTWHITKADYTPTQNNSIVKGVQGFVAGALMDRNQMLKDYGLLKHYAWEKRFPIGWQAWNEESMKNLIAGLFAADGSVFSTLTGRNDRIQVNITFGMTSEACLKDLHEALMYGFGISSRFENPTIAGGFRSSAEKRIHPLHALEISRAEDVIKFCEVFSDHVPGIKRAKLIEETSKIVIKNHNPYAKAMFLEKEYAGKVHCMDIEVDHPDHLFVLANGLITSNSSTAKGGDWAKQMAQAAADMVIRKDDCGTHNGLVLDIDDKSLKGRVLARETAGFKPGTLITRDVLAKMRKEKVKDVEARSPLTCGVHNGLCSKCVGRFYNGGKWAKIGQHVGVEASTSTAEPVCLVKGTEVRMADGSIKKIEDIEPGEYVLGSDMNGYCKPVRVLNKFHNGPRDCYRSYIKKGYGKNSGHIILESTAEHKILGTTRSRSVALHDAKLNIAPIGTMPESKYTVRMCQSITGSEGGTVNEPMAMLLGMLIGDGSYKGTASGAAKHAVRLSCYDDAQLAVLREELAPLNLLVQEYTTAHEYRIVEADQYDKKNWTAIEGITCSERTKVRNRVRAKLIQEGMWGQDCYTKTLPKAIWDWDTESVCKFVGGLIATDGYVTKNGSIGYASNSLTLLQQIKELLQFRLGIYSSNITSSQKKKPDGTLYNPTYKFTIDEAGSVVRFAELIQIPGRKNAILLAANRKLNGKRRGLYKLEKQEYIGVQDTWDLEVDNDTHLFALANGLIVSNTQMALCIAGFEYVNRPDGSKIRIRNIEPGQEVCAADKHGHITTAKVLNVFDQGIKQVRTFTFEYIVNYGRPLLLDDGTVFHTPIVYGQTEVTCTEDHKFLYADGTVAPIKDIYESGKLNKVLLLEDQRKAVLIEASAPREEHCYDIEIDHPDHLFVLSSGFICSNSAKHTAGMTQSKKTYSGLGVIQQFTQSPEKFKDEGTVATIDGKVEKIAEAPQGGMYITIKGKKHYILPGHEVEVKEGQELEAGDQLAEGLVDPEDIVKYKGLGEGRRYWADRLGKILEDSGTPSDRRNLEVLARAAIRHVRVTNQDGMGDYLPDDVIDYNALQDSYHPDEETTRQVRPKDAVGKYLQVPVLHYTIGTRITPKVAKFIQDHGHDKISVEDKAPSFIPEMIRLRTASHSNPDWMASMGTSYLTKQLNEAATEGDDTNVRQNADWRPRLAFGAGFGNAIATTGEF